MLVSAGLNDPRVTYWEPAKWVARLRSVRTNDAALLLRTNMGAGHAGKRSEEHTSELQSLMRISYAVFCLKKKNIAHRCAETYIAHKHNDEKQTYKRHILK